MVVLVRPHPPPRPKHQGPILVAKPVLAREFALCPCPRDGQGFGVSAAVMVALLVCAESEADPAQTPGCLWGCMA